MQMFLSLPSSLWITLFLRFDNAGANGPHPFLCFSSGVHVLDEDHHIRHQPCRSADRHPQELQDVTLASVSAVADDEDASLNLFEQVTPGFTRTSRPSTSTFFTAVPETENWMCIRWTRGLMAETLGNPAKQSTYTIQYAFCLLRNS